MIKKLLTSFVAIIAIINFTIAQVPNYIPTNGLQAWYAFNNNAFDSSGNGNNLVNIGVTFVADRFGNAASAGSFDGVSDYCQKSSPSFTMASTDSFSYSKWVIKHHKQALV